MDFIERWLHISPDGGNGMSEILVLSSVVLTVLIVAVTGLRRYLPRRLIKFLEQIGKRKDSDLSNH
jgi:hypothetical protein